MLKKVLKNATGRPGIEVTDEARQLVVDLSAQGFRKSYIASKLGIGVRSLDNHFREELDEGYADLEAELTKTAVGMALKGDKALLIFILKSRFKWTQEHTAEEKDPLEIIARDEDPEVDDRGSTEPV